MPREIDYALARRAVLRDLERGALSRTDVCDAHPELLRAGRSLGEARDAACPVCGTDGLRSVFYVYGDQLRSANGRCVAGRAELERLGSRHDEFSCYDVEVCLDCGWNHLLRTWLHGRLHIGDGADGAVRRQSPRRVRPGQTARPAHPARSTR